jgi:hypothetical protein
MPSTRSCEANHLAHGSDPSYRPCAMTSKELLRSRCVTYQRYGFQYKKKRRAYGESWWRTLIKFTTLSVGYKRRTGEFAQVRCLNENVQLDYEPAVGLAK